MSREQISKRTNRYLFLSYILPSRIALSVIERTRQPAIAVR